MSEHGDESQRCVIQHVAYMGPQYEVTVAWHGQQILLQVNATRLQPNVGEQYYLEIHPTACLCWRMRHNKHHP